VETPLKGIIRNNRDPEDAMLQRECDKGIHL
jgi:hypothetical protein